MCVNAKLCGTGEGKEGRENYNNYTSDFQNLFSFLILISYDSPF